ncbi:MAG: polysaccharide biosynthesis tyrosine autokinase [Phormidesmis sp. RL_2_1]|nr:polysaccharide biosynthesis tyrosine autokinase [Phormidesmis sp. RL_2_1]
MKTDDILQLPQFNQPIGAAEGTEETLDLGRLLRSLVRNWWVIGGVVVVTTTAAGLKVLTDTAEYAGRFEVLVQPDSAETEVISNIPETLSNDELPPKITVDGDLLKILKSPQVLAPVVEAAKVRYPKFCGGPEVLAEAVAEDAAAVNNICYEGIASQLSVSAVDDPLDENSTIVQVAFRDGDSEAVQFVLNELSQAYLDYSLEVKQADIRRGIDFVDQKLPDLRSKVDTLQAQLQNLRSQNNIIDPAARASQLAEQIGTFSQAQQEVEVELSEARAVASDLQQQLSGRSQEQVASSALADNPRYQTLLNSLLELDSQIAQASTLYLDASPDMQVLKEQRQNLLILLASEGEQSQREMINQINQLETRSQSLQQTLQGLNADVGQLTGVARQYDDIQRELEVASENLNQFIAKREALAIDSAQREIPWELVTPPTSPKEVSTNLLRYLLLGGTLGLLLGIGIALLIDESSGVIYSEDELRRTTRLPVLATIPDYAIANGLPLNKNGATARGSRARQYASVGVGRQAEIGQAGIGQTNGKQIGFREDHAAAGNGSGYGRSAEDGRFGYGNDEPTPINGRAVSIPAYAQDPFSEAFRSLYTNLRLLNTPEPIRSIAISSVMADEGKSTVALHLAEAAAAMGQRVLLVDGDLRNPQIHNYLELSNEKGLTNLFSGESNPAIIQRFAPEPNMYVIAAGSAFFDPTRLFSSRSMKRFNKKVEARFDLVIYDTPPLLGQSDAYLIADNTDGLLLVTRPGKLKQPLLDRAMEQLRIADINVLGIVAREV